MLQDLADVMQTYVPQLLSAQWREAIQLQQRCDRRGCECFGLPLGDRETPVLLLLPQHPSPIQYHNVTERAHSRLQNRTATMSPYSDICSPIPI